MFQRESKVASEGGRRNIGEKRRLSEPFSIRIRAYLGAVLVSAGLILSSALASTASATPITITPPGGSQPPPLAVTPPGLYPLQATAQAVDIRWYDRSTIEQKFVVYKRDRYGAWQVVYQVPTRNVQDMSGDYSYLDTDTSVSGQCYRIAAVDSKGSAGYTQEQCTVRPDPSRFPQSDPASTEQWYGLNNANDGTGDLYNSAQHMSLANANQNFGVDLNWQTNPALWKIEAQGGPHLMRGQAVALRVWGGGWLKYGNETWGVDLVLSDTPSYEWYVLGGTPGSTIGNGSFALWNSAANDYLVSGDETWGVNVNWYKKTQSSPPPPPPPPQGVKTFVAYNCITEQRPLEMWVSDLSAGGGWTDEGRLESQYAGGGCPETGQPFTFTPQSGHQYEVRSVDYQASGCSNDPTDGSCWRSDTTFVGDANGQVISTDIG
jgi:hypothetical protein